MHRHVGGVGDQRAVGGEHRAGEVEPLLDVDRIGGVLQRHPHLLGDRHEQVVEHFQHDRIGLGPDRALPLEGNGAGQDQMVLGGDLGAPAMLDHDGLVWFDDDGGAGHLVARRELRAEENCRVVPSAAGIEARAVRRCREGSRRHRRSRFGELGPAADRLDRDGFDHQLLRLVDEAEACLVRSLEGGLDRRQIGGCPIVRDGALRS
jgi:hypothetical protein